MTMESSAIQAKLDALFAPFNRTDAPGLVVAVARGNEVLFRRGYGMASLEHAVANTPATRMRIGSTSKHFTCLAALLLAEDGKLDVDAGIRHYLHELPLLAGDPTLVQLMTHTSGYRCFLDLGLLTQGLAMVPRGAALATQVRQQDVNFPPGERMMYSNGGYHLLSLVIERMSGMPFEAFLKTRIFDVMGMADTESLPNDMAIRSRVATLHIPDGHGGYRRGLFPSWEVLGEGAIVSTVDDMLRWLAHLRGPKRVGSPASWQRMFSAPSFSSGERSTYSLGLKSTPYRGVELLHHAGGVIGGSCQMLTVAAHALDVIVLTNGAPVNPAEIAKRIVDIVLADCLTGDQPPEPASVAGREGLLGRYYSPRSRASFELIGQQDTLMLVGFHTTALPMPLFESACELRIETGSEGPYAVRHDVLPVNGAIASRVEIVHCGHSETFERVTDTPPSVVEASSGLTGEYEGPDAGARASLALQDDVLTLRMQGGLGSISYQLEPVCADLFDLAPLDPLDVMRGTLSVERTGRHVERFWINTWRTRNLLFTRAA
ncbi:serine hydrolase domain-containing protein [Paraburkholderia sediminicola]|jgi:D-aminopeptidase|uniref:serine hydrolase domain-containing protein n=1 Tax=Paraburkholderia sediminicola TaxID=458836 RepID=UPI00284A6342|nr:serine hydrolase [Rudaea sp.]